MDQSTSNKLVRKTVRKMKDDYSEMSCDTSQKNARCLNNRDRFDELLNELEGWSGTHFFWAKPGEKKGIWESRCSHTYMGNGGFTQKHGVGILLNEGWNERTLKQIMSANEWSPPQSNATNEGLKQPVFTSPTQGAQTFTSRKCAKASRINDHHGWFQRLVWTWYGLFACPRWKACNGAAQQTWCLDEAVVETTGLCANWLESEDIAPTPRPTTCFTWRVTTDHLLRIIDSHALRRKEDWTT